MHCHVSLRFDTFRIHFSKFHFQEFQGQRWTGRDEWAHVCQNCQSWPEQWVNLEDENILPAWTLHVLHLANPSKWAEPYKLKQEREKKKKNFQMSGSNNSSSYLLSPLTCLPFPAHRAQYWSCPPPLGTCHTSRRPQVPSHCGRVQTGCGGQWEVWWRSRCCHQTRFRALRHGGKTWKEGKSQEGEEESVSCCWSQENKNHVVMQSTQFVT